MRNVCLRAIYAVCTATANHTTGIWAVTQSLYATFNVAHDVIIEGFKLVSIRICDNRTGLPYHTLP